MNRFINAVLLFLFFPTMILAIFVGLDLPIEALRTSGSQLPYRHEIFLGLGIFMMIIIVRRSIRRWMGLNLVNRTAKFIWNEPMSETRIKRVQVYTFLEGFVMVVVAAGLLQLTTVAWLPASALIFGALDGVVFTLVGSRKDRFRAGITSKAVIVADRDVSLVYFSGLRKVSIHQQTIYFDYIKGLQLSIPLDCLTSAQKERFFTTLEDQIDRDKVFITKNR